jgi:hypothetical protein
MSGCCVVLIGKVPTGNAPTGNAPTGHDGQQSHASPSPTLSQPAVWSEPSKEAA